MTKAALRRREIFSLAAAGTASLLPGCAGANARTASTPRSSSRTGPGAFDARDLSQLRGFNLLSKFQYGQDGPYDEWDLDFVAEHGFNFVRLPTDYRCWTQAPGKYREQPLAEIERTIGWARARNIHVNLALHRAPGYSVSSHSPEALDLWAEGAGGEARAQFLAQWRMLAERLSDVPASALSFNLLNEPAEVTGAAYRELVEPVVSCIREFNRDRLIIADGVDYARKPVPELVALGVAQSTRGYAPFQLTHYRADWVEGAERWPTPSWPVPVRVNQYLFGPQKGDFKSPLILRGSFPGGAEIGLHVQQVSQRVRVSISGDGEQIFALDLEPKDGAGDWKTSAFHHEWKIYQAIYDRVYTGRLVKPCRELRVEVLDGDWMTFSKLSIGQARVVPNDAEWGKRQGTFNLDARGGIVPRADEERVDRARLYAETVEPWLKFSREHGVPVHVGEWGAHRYTPHAVVLAWMQDCLANWARAELGWALWNLRGSFGCVDSGRSDVTYERYRGKKLDRRMLELLKTPA